MLVIGSHAGLLANLLLEQGPLQLHVVEQGPLQTSLTKQVRSALVHDMDVRKAQALDAAPNVHVLDMPLDALTDAACTADLVVVSGLLDKRYANA